MPRYYVADVYMNAGSLVQTKCAFGSRGRATGDCHDELVADMVPEQTAPPAEQREEPAPISRAPEAAHPAPSNADIAHAFAAPGVHKLVELCRATYAPDLTTLHVTLTVTPSGEVRDVAASDAPVRFVECASRALHTANIASYDGAEIISEQTLAM
jgi:hypothetical protein